MIVSQIKNEIKQSLHTTELEEKKSQIKKKNEMYKKKNESEGCSYLSFFFIIGKKSWFKKVPTIFNERKKNLEQRWHNIRL